jgi:quinol-cytochrome oxidoreductase complex cytochrome b subunit
MVWRTLKMPSTAVWHGAADPAGLPVQGDHMLGYDYPLLGVFWSLLMFSFFVLWIFIVVWVFIDNFRRHDHHGVAKALWFLFIVFIPVIGVLAYIIARPADADIGVAPV